VIEIRRRVCEMEEVSEECMAGEGNLYKGE